MHWSQEKGLPMGEIKSTLEIALEKAKAMEISTEDRARFKEEEIFAKAREIFQQFVNHSRRESPLAEEIKRSGKDASLLRKCLIEIFLNALDLSHSSERIWQGLQELGLRDPGPHREAVIRIAEDDKRARRDKAEKLETMLRESLAREGISGTAVDLNIEGSSQWKDFLTQQDHRVSEELERLRQDISRVIEGDSSSPR